MKWQASAPSNIALIKYMGKLPDSGNRPSNPSLSYTVDHLRSYVELEHLQGATAHNWQPLPGYPELKLSETGLKKFTDHLDRVGQIYESPFKFRIRSANDFPSDCGLASSASSFAALTRVAVQAFSQLTGRPALTVSEQAKLSRAGSGSSCRSFFAPFALWQDEGAEEIDVGISKLLHQAIVVGAEKKPVTTSQAHLRVTSSSLFVGRPQRAEQRLNDLVKALRAGDWRAAYAITWAEFWDMHALFETAAEPFGYMSDGSLKVLQVVREYWQEHGDGPLVTMDAGSNVHLFYRLQQEAAASMMRERLGKHFSVLEAKA